MLIKIPTLERYIDDEGNVQKKQGEMKVQIDTSFLAHLKWEEQFQPAVGYDLATYTAMVREWIKDENKQKTHFVGMLKLLYCYVNGDEIPTFREFAKLFDYEIADQILNKISAVLEEINKSVSAKN